MRTGEGIHETRVPSLTRVSRLAVVARLAGPQETGRLADRKVSCPGGDSGAWKSLQSLEPNS